MMNLSVGAILLYSLVGAVILVYVPFLVVGFARFQVGYDRSAPRAMLDKLPPYARKSYLGRPECF